MRFEDLDSIMEIEENSFTTPWSRKAFEGELLNEFALYHCLEFDGKLVAYVGLWQVFDEGHITNVAVLPSYRGLGLSKILLTNLFDMCPDKGIEKLTLEVRKSNTVAIKLYENLGFFAAGLRPNYYSKPTEAAVIMWKELEKK
jgi:ribosomal-protein-alanine N-acetyltransferase